MSATPTTVAPSQPKPTKILACVHCQYRKIKCDRQQPCSNCIKAKISCKPSIPAPPHKRRRPNQDLLERLGRCEQLLKQYASGNAPSQGDAALDLSPISAPTTTEAGRSRSSSRLTPSSTPGEIDARSGYKPAGRVVEEDGNPQFMDNFVRLSFQEELNTIKKMVDDTEQEFEPGTAGLSPGNSSDLILGVEDAAIDLQELQPDIVNVFRLWQYFVDRVNPITKVVHIPSLQPFMLDSASDITKVPLPYQALLFSIYTMAVVSLTNHEAIQLLSMTREEAVNRFARGTKLALTRANFMQNYNMTILQALALHMLSLTNSANNNSIWIMGGTVMRIAQKMGYHRDGETFNFSPFETEMRRRLWWHVITQDSKYTLMSGLSHSWVASNWDTKMPLNLDDADLIPDSMEPLVPRDGPTEMAFVLIVYRYGSFQTKTHGAFEAAFMSLREGSKGNSHQNAPSPVETYLSLVDDIDAELAEFEQQYVDPSAGGIQEAASLIRPLFIHKMRDIMIPVHEQPEYGTEIFDQVDSLFKSFVTSHTDNAAAYKRLANTEFLWLFRSGFQLDAMLLLTSKLYKRPTGKLTERAWVAFQSFHDLYPDLYDVSQKKCERQAHFTLKAWAIREQAVAQQTGRQLEVPEFIQRLRQLVSPSRTTSSASYPPSTASPTSASQQLFVPKPPQMSPYQQQPLQLQSDLSDMNQYINNSVDTSNFGVDMWGNLMMDDTATNQQQALPYGGFDFSKLDFSSMDFAI